MVISVGECFTSNLVMLSTLGMIGRRGRYLSTVKIYSSALLSQGESRCTPELIALLLYVRKN